MENTIKPSRPYLRRPKSLQADKGLDFKELLGSLHGLCILAKARGIDGELPWHLAVAMKASIELEGTL